MIRRALAVALLLGPPCLFAESIIDRAGLGQLKTIRVNEVEIHYLERGQGMPVILIHGGLGDYREWTAQIPALASGYRVIAYSRRYNFPNSNPTIAPNHSALVEADDLAGLIDALKLERVHLVGYSYGGFTALCYATQHPDRVRSLTLAEPPVLDWLKNIDGGQVERDRFLQDMWRPAAQAFQRDKPEEALRITCDYFSGKGSYDQMPKQVRDMLQDNVREWKALTTSTDAFPPLGRDVVQKLALPILLISGEKTLPPLRMIHEELLRLLPWAEELSLPNATHDMWIEEPEACGRALRNFLEGN
ncbi:MAG: hypothetical protein QOG67_3487 [Verrucomicrobiota bacterium]